MGVVVTSELGIYMIGNAAPTEPADSIDNLVDSFRDCYAMQVDVDGDWWCLILREGRLRWTPMEETIPAIIEEEEYPPLCEVIPLTVVRP